MRVIAKEYDITPKQLHKDFKAAHGGQIPDDWVKQNHVAEECGWFPLHEVALVNREVTHLMCRCIGRDTPDDSSSSGLTLLMPKKSEMQKAAEPVLS